MNENDKIQETVDTHDDFDSMVDEITDRQILAEMNEVHCPFPSGLNQAGWGGVL